MAGQETPSSVVENLQRILTESAGDVVTAYLFGSVGRGTARPGSDLDVAVLYSQDPPPTFEGLPLRLQETLENALRVHVDVVVLNTASPDLRHRVLRDGTLLLDRDPGRRIRFEVQTRNEFFDLEPYLVEYRRGARA